jgi:hypothetical protein
VVTPPDLSIQMANCFVNPASSANMAGEKQDKNNPVIKNFFKFKSVPQKQKSISWVIL